MFDAVNDQLDEKGTVIDATVVQAQGRLPRYPTDGEGGRIGSPIYPEPDWGRRSNFGFKGHLAIDDASWLVRDARLTPAQVGDIGMFEGLIQGDEGIVCAEAAYVSAGHATLVAPMGETNAGEAPFPILPFTWNSTLAPMTGRIPITPSTVRKHVRYAVIARNEVLRIPKH